MHSFGSVPLENPAKETALNFILPVYVCAYIYAFPYVCACVHGVCTCVYVRVCMHVFMCVYVCACGGQRTIPYVSCQNISALYFEIGHLIDPELT